MLWAPSQAVSLPGRDENLGIMMATGEGGTGQNLTSRTQARIPLGWASQFCRGLAWTRHLPTVVADLQPAWGTLEFWLQKPPGNLGLLTPRRLLPAYNKWKPSSDSISKGRRRVLVFSSQNPLYSLAHFVVISLLVSLLGLTKGRGVSLACKISLSFWRLCCRPVSNPALCFRICIVDSTLATPFRNKYQDPLSLRASTSWGQAQGGRTTFLSSEFFLTCLFPE